MKLSIYYRKNSDHSAMVEKYIRDLKIIKHIEPVIKDIDAVESQITMRTYDVTSYPVITVETEHGEVEKIWQGAQLPLMNDISGYLFN